MRALAKCQTNFMKVIF
jgi:hypothetical protein